MEIRTLDWSRDRAAILSFDVGFETDRIYTLCRSELDFSLVAEPRTPPFTKRYEITLTEEAIQSALVAIAACDGAMLLGFAVVREETWNRRAVVTDFYVARHARRQGLGRKMMRELCERLARTSVRLLWLETQNVNFPAIQFYRQMGFAVCGFDSTLYDGASSGEAAIHMSKELRRK